MEIKYFNDTDTLLLTFNSNPVVASEDVSENLLVDLDQQGNPVALTIEHARLFTNVDNFSFQRILHQSTEVN
ncbi:MAG: DUF2283 domain-containing protein [Bacteroidetes bacterium]|nr:DUF2283 domain-containing protein [Fibrella sp.]